jgi:hypothetical protein
VAGLGLLSMAILAPIANFGVLQKLIVSGDVTNTAAMFTFIGEVLLIFWLLWGGIMGFDKESELK